MLPNGRQLVGVGGRYRQALRYGGPLSSDNSNGAELSAMSPSMRIGTCIIADTETLFLVSLQSLHLSKCL